MKVSNERAKNEWGLKVIVMGTSKSNLGDKVLALQTKVNFSRFLLEILLLDESNIRGY